MWTGLQTRPDFQCYDRSGGTALESRPHIFNRDSTLSFGCGRWPHQGIRGVFRSGLLGCPIATRRFWLKTIAHYLFALIILATALPMVSAQTQGASPSSPAPAGATVAGIIECGEGYTSHELYDMKITLLEVIRGEEAWKRIREASSSNKPAASGTEYLLARIRFEYSARGTPGTCIYPLAPKEFTAYSAKGEDYETVSVVPPKPKLRKDLKSGEAAEGWLVFAVPKEDKAPLMLYSAADSGGAVEHGGGKWFLLVKKQ